jgi:hypothetical protein
MTQTVRWILYHNTEKGRTPVAVFTRDGDQWTISVPETPHRSAVKTILPSVSLYEKRRAVQQNEGDDYLKALQETFGRSSAWVLIEDDSSRQVAPDTATAM